MLTSHNINRTLMKRAQRMIFYSNGCMFDQPRR